jgi:uncharacterized FlaG/YvyC family protein
MLRKPPPTEEEKKKIKIESLEKAYEYLKGAYSTLENAKFELNEFLWHSDRGAEESLADTWKQIVIRIQDMISDLEIRVDHYRFKLEYGPD